MDIIYTDSERVEQGILNNCKADIDIGNKNTFSIETNIKNTCQISEKYGSICPLLKRGRHVTFLLIDW